MQHKHLRRRPGHRVLLICCANVLAAAALVGLGTGEAGAQTPLCFGAPATTTTGTPGPDVIIGTPGDDLIEGRAAST